MTRFIMSPHEAVRLLIESGDVGKPGEVLITKMPAVRMADLAEVMLEKYAPRFGFRPEGIPILTVGARTGEKWHEELMNEEETRRSSERGDYYVVHPALALGGNSSDPRWTAQVSVNLGECQSARSRANFRRARPGARSEAGV